MTPFLRASLLLTALQLSACGGIGIDRRDEHGTTALMRAAARGDQMDVERLLARGASVNAKVPTRDLREMIAFLSWMQQLPKSDIGYTPLHYGVLGGNPEVVRLLLARGARPDAPDRGLMTPADLAVLRGDAGLLDQLVQAGARPTPHQLALATRIRKAEIVRYLVEHGVDPDARESQRRGVAPPPPIVAAAMTGDSAVVRTLLDLGANPDARDQNGWTAVRWARQSRGGRSPSQAEAVVAMLERAGAKDLSGAKADELFNAIYARDEAAVRAALRNGANPNARDMRGATPLVYAGRLGLADAVAALVAAGAHVNVTFEYESTPLVAAIEGGSVAAVKTLLDAGARTDLKGRIGPSPVEAASRSKNTEITQVLLTSSRSGADPDALVAAALNGQLEQVKLLLATGADPKTGRGRGALSEAARGCTRHDNTEVIRALLDAGADPRVHAHGGDISALHRAAALCSIEAVRLLIDHGADVNARDINQNTVLVYARGRPDIEALLRSSGAK